MPEEVRPTVTDIDRFGTPLYTITEASHYLGVLDSTFRTLGQGIRAAFR